MDVTETNLIKLLAQKDEAAFEYIFKENFKNLQSYAFTIVSDAVLAEEAVQNVFLKLWDRTATITIQASLKAYLYRAVYNESCNFLKHQKVKDNYAQYAKHSNNNVSPDKASLKVGLSELEEKIKTALNDLPEQCRTIFQLSRFEELKYQEIANKLGLSIKTVEAQMGKALKIMRIKLVDYLPLIVSFIILKILSS
jgi:RNA polymerase sigma-70 factor, ECF subfamily